MKKIRKFFDIENSLWKSNFCTLQRHAKLGKASWDAYNQKDCIAEGVPSNVIDSKLDTWFTHKNLDQMDAVAVISPKNLMEMHFLFPFLSIYFLSSILQRYTYTV